LAQLEMQADDLAEMADYTVLAKTKESGLR
jgi:hypothetical protein